MLWDFREVLPVFPAKNKRRLGRETLRFPAFSA